MDRSLPTQLLRFVFTTLLLASIAHGQVLTEVPMQTTEKHGMETINLGDLTISISIPIRHKNALVPLTMVATQNIAYATVPRYLQAPQLALFGSTFRPYVEGLAGNATVVDSTDNGDLCNPPNPTYTYQRVSNFNIVTSDGQMHPAGTPSPAFPGGPLPFVLDVPSCPSGYTYPDPTSGTTMAVDGSGYQLNMILANYGQTRPAGPFIIDKDGSSMYFLGGTSGTAYRDRNGNQNPIPTLALNPSNQTCAQTYTIPCYYTQTWGDTTANTFATVNEHAWTLGSFFLFPGCIQAGPGGSIAGENVVNITAAGCQPYIPDSINYADASGSAQGYSFTYTTYNFLGNFGCPNGADANSPNTPNITLVTSVTFPDGGVMNLGYEQSFGKDSTYTTGRLTYIKWPTGGTETFAYSGGNNGINCTDGTPATITRTTTDSGTPWTYVHTPYSGYQSQATTTTVTDPLGNTTTYTFNSLGSNGGSASSSPGLYLQSQKQEYDSGSHLQRTTVTCYNGMSPASKCAPATTLLPEPYNPLCGAYNGVNLCFAFVEVAQFVTDVPSGLTSSTDTKYDLNGNVTSSSVTNWGASSPMQTTSIAYGTWNGSACVAIGNNILDKACDEKEVDSSGNVIAESRYTYNSQGDNLTESHWSGGTNWLTTTYTYNSNGTMQQMTRPNNSKVNYTYNDGCGGNYLTKQQEQSGAMLAITYTVTCPGGVTLTAQDSNGAVTTSDYLYNGADPYWRVKRTVDAAGAATAFTYATNSKEGGMSINGGAATSDSIDYIDGYARKYLSQSLNESGTWNSVMTAYDADGRLSTVSQPCVSSTKGTGCTGALTTTTYDALGRIHSVTDANGGYVSVSRYGNDWTTLLGPVTTTPATENLKSYNYEKDALNRVTSVCEITTTANGGGACNQHTSATGYLTAYTHSTMAGGSQLAVAQGSQLRTFTYDALGRMTYENNPETGNNSVNGSEYYFFDTQSSSCGSHSYPGELVEIKRNSGGHICRNYDTLGRIVSVGNSATAGCSYYAYDSAPVTPPTGITVTNTKDRLVEQWTVVSSCVNPPPTPSSMVTDEWFSYDADGRLIGSWELTPSSGAYFFTGAAYYEHGLASSLTFGNMGPLPTSIAYGVDSVGRYNIIGNWINGATYNAAGEPLTVQFCKSGGAGTCGGNGDSDVFAYDANTARLKTTTFNIGLTKSIINSYSWNTNGTLQQVATTDPFYAIDQHTCVYSHDDLNRLASVNCGSSVWQQNFSYDRYGNLTKTVPQGGTGGTWTPGYTTYNQYIGLPYDSDGELLSDTLNTYTWDSYGRVSSIYDGVSTHLITYDAASRVVETTNPTRQIVYGPSGKVAVMQGTGVVKASFIPAIGTDSLDLTGSGSLTSPVVRHGVLDGTVPVETNTFARTVNSDKSFAPFGETFNIGSAGNGDTDFTGHTQDIVAGAYDFEKREMLANQGRWINPDPAGIMAVKMGDPQTWNRYAYTGNTPEVKVDPLGLSPDVTYCVDGNCGGSEGGGWTDIAVPQFIEQHHFMSAPAAQKVDSVNKISKQVDKASQTMQAQRSAHLAALAHAAGQDTAMPPGGSSSRVGSSAAVTGVNMGLIFTPKDLGVSATELVGGLVTQGLQALGVQIVSANTENPVPVPIPAELAWIEEIVNGHGWDEHGESSDYGSKEEYKQLILETVQNAQGGEIVRNPDGRKGVTGFWNDKEGFVVWHNNKSPGQGTAFRPDDPDVYKTRWGFK